MGGCAGPCWTRPIGGVLPSPPTARASAAPPSAGVEAPAGRRARRRAVPAGRRPSCGRTSPVSGPSSTCRSSVPGAPTSSAPCGREIAAIPYGETLTYGEIARAVGEPGGAQAVGVACNRNPLPVIVPCHRVVGADGKLVGFGGGLPRKRQAARARGPGRAATRLVLTSRLPVSAWPSPAAESRDRRYACRGRRPLRSRPAVGPHDGRAGWPMRQYQRRSNAASRRPARRACADSGQPSGCLQPSRRPYGVMSRSAERPVDRLVAAPGRGVGPGIPGRRRAGST